MKDLQMNDTDNQNFRIFFNGKKVAVTGASGFIGTHFIDALVHAHADVRAILHQSPLKIARYSDVEIVTADLSRSDEAIAALMGADMVIHAAGPVGAAGVGASAFMSGIANSISLFTRVCEAAWKANVKRLLIFSSSTGYPVVEHAVQETEFWDGPVHESYYGYGWMRRYYERVAEYVGKNSGTEVVIIRPSAPFGPFDNFNPQSCHVVPALIHKAFQHQKHFEVWGTGNEIRDFLYVEDLIEGCLHALAKAPNLDPINIGSGVTTTIQELAHLILEVTGHADAELRFDASKPMMIPVRRVNIAKANALLGFVPRHSLKEGLEKTVAWYKSNVIARSD